MTTAPSITIALDSMDTSKQQIVAVVHTKMVRHVQYSDSFSCDFVNDTLEAQNAFVVKCL